MTFSTYITYQIIKGLRDILSIKYCINSCISTRVLHGLSNLVKLILRVLNLPVLDTENSESNLGKCKLHVYSFQG